MTTRHTDRCSQLGKNIKRCHNCNRGRKSFQITTNSAGLDLLCCDHDKNHNRPCRFCRKIGCRASKSDKTDQIGNYTCRKKRCNKRYHVSEFLTHVSNYKAIGFLYYKLSQRLSLGNILFFQIMCQPDAQSCNQNHYDPAYYHCLTDP